MRKSRTANRSTGLMAFILAGAALLLLSNPAAANTEPSVKIDIPNKGATFEVGKPIKFDGKAVDMEDGKLSGKSLSWTSDIDGFLGYGESITISKLSVGSHIILLRAKDSGGLAGRDATFVVVKSPEKPVLEFTQVPGYGSSEKLKGNVSGIKPDDVRVLVYIMVDGAWWTKPLWDSPFTKVDADGTWACNIATGGTDETATRIVAYLVRADCKPPLAAGEASLADELEKKALAKVEAAREKPKPAVAQQKPPGKLKLVCYSPFRDNQDPDMGVYPTLAEIEGDLNFISRVAMGVRTYGVSNTPGSIPSLCERAGIDCYPGAWLGKYKTENDREINALVSIASQELKCVKALIVGNEVLLRKDLTQDELIDHIRKVKKSAGIPVTYAEIWGWWLKNQRVANEVDFLLVHVHPYWEGVPVEKAAEHVVRVWKYIRETFPGRRVVIGETGWPSEGQAMGKAVPSKENQARFFREFTALAEKEGVEYFWFGVFDEKWKGKFEGKTGAFWGLYNSDGSIKPEIRPLMLAEAAAGIRRPPGKVSVVVVSAPLVVYTDAEDKNGFEPSGWLGDGYCLTLDKACETNPHSGKTCVRITYNPDAPPTNEWKGETGNRWAGIYWQYPLNNWGDYPGYKLSGATRLTFWARGEKGGERAEFKVGGISSSGKPYKDSFGPLEIGVVTLTREWKQYSIDLKGADTGSLIGGFCWVTNSWQNTGGCTVYVDDIVFETADGPPKEAPVQPAPKAKPSQQVKQMLDPKQDPLDPKVLMPLAPGNTWTYAWKSAALDGGAKKEKPTFFSKNSYEYGGKGMHAICFHYEAVAHEETYAITRNEGDHYWYTVSSKPEVQSSQLRDGRYEDSADNCWTFWKEKSGEAGMTESIKRKWKYPMDDYLLDKRGDRPDELPIDNRNVIHVKMQEGRFYAAFSFLYARTNDDKTQTVTKKLGYFTVAEVKVPAGTFKDCFEFVETVPKDEDELKKDAAATKPDGGEPMFADRGKFPKWARFETHTFFAPGVGMVREYQMLSDGSIGYELELLKFTKGDEKRD